MTQKLREKWLGDDESAQTINPPAYKPNRPTIRLVTHSSYPPFTYIKDNVLIGHDIELTYLFCEAMDYNLDVKFYEPSAVLPVLISGRGDLLCGGISITEERKQSINFSVPTFKAGVVAVIRKPENTDGEHLRYNSIEELNKKGINIGMGTGMSFETLCRQRVPKASILYFNTYTDMANSIKKGKLDAAILDKPSADMLIANVGGIGYLPELFVAEDYAVIFPKTAKGAALRDEFNVFLNKIKADGRLAEM
ncbi:MAG: amino acid ABC transporter substrate-binding protein, partial [Spirochaetales bacterium]|nr:amino acid ABC transporter substrate-binding protein [Spirochaetales bacterium]